MIGRTVGSYRVLDKLGEGGMGEVYRATDTRLGRDVALKVLPATTAGDPERLARFQREARAVAALNHPHIVTIYSVDEAEGVQFLTMELVEGQSLDRVIPERGLPADRIIEIGGAIADALAAAHDKGIVHRDLKPANVMVTSGGRIKVLDFGLAKDLRETHPVDATLTAAGQTREGVVMGTPAYMSPEQIAGRALDHRTDLFSLGILLYEMATGRRPFEDTSSAELASAILRDTPPRLEHVRPDLPDDLARIVGRCLEKEPRWRYATALELKHDLAQLTARPSASAGASIAVLPFVDMSPAHDRSTSVTGLPRSSSTRSRTSRTCASSRAHRPSRSRGATWTCVKWGARSTSGPCSRAASAPRAAASASPRSW